MNANQVFFPDVDADDAYAGPISERRLAERDSDEAFKIIVTLREAIEAADSVERRIEGTSDRRYATFLTKVRDRHRQIAETARGLIVDMIVAMSGEAAPTKAPPSLVRKRAS
jgi:hypothetical protein